MRPPSRSPTIITSAVGRARRLLLVEDECLIALILVEELAARGTTVLLSTHILEVAQALCRRVAIIDRGHIVATGTMDELRAQAGSEQASLEDLFLKLTAGPESKELIERLLAPKQ